jgi:Alpha-(1->3)-arabinofuranosyltransferase
VWRLRLAACSLALAAVVFWQRPGRLVADTDVALALDPVGLIGRAWRFWHADHQFGTVRDAPPDAFPAALLFSAGDVAGFPAWVTQRVWWSVLLVVAFLGLVRLTGALSVRSQPARIVAGLGYALSPAVLAGLESVSTQVWPVALAPWVLLPVVRAWAGRSPRRYAAVSALVVAAAGAASPVATMAAALPALFLLALAQGWPGGLRGRLRFAALWFGSVLAATAWWWAPWLLAVRYAQADGDWWQGGVDGLEWAIVDAPAIGAGGLAVLGLAGLAVRRSPARLAMFATVAAGAALTVAGFSGSGSLVALPLAVGVAQLGTAIRPRRRPEAAVRVAVITVAGLLVVVMAAPVLAASPVRDDSAEAIPHHWPEVADWLGRHAASGRALIVPGTASTIFRWGVTAGEPLAGFATGPWAVRNGAPTPVEELLEAVERRLEAGRGGPAVTATLERAGITHLVVRNDLDRDATDTPFPLRVYQAIRDTPGLTWAGSFGERTGWPDAPGEVVDGGLDPVFSAIDVFRIGAPAAEARARIYPLDDGADPAAVGLAPVVLSAPPLPGHECAPYGQWWRCGSELAGPGGAVGDGLTGRVELASGGEYRIMGEALPRPGPELERLLRPEPGGIRVRASSRSIDAPVGRPQSAVDGDPGTSWIARVDDQRPEVVLSWAGERTIRGLEFEYAPALAASRPSQLLITASETSWIADVGREGAVRFDQPIRTSRISVRIVRSTPVVDRDTRTGVTTMLPPGVSELRVVGADDLVRAVDAAAPVALDCGHGPDVVLNGRPLPTAVEGTVGDVLAGRPLRLTVCEDGVVGRLEPGVHVITAEPTAQMRPVTVILEPIGEQPVAGPVPELGVFSWDDVHRVVTVGERTDPALLVVPENWNAGWEARLDGSVLDQVRHDGWAQAYVVPPGPAGFIVLRYPPDVTYRELLITGALALAVVVGMAAFPESGRRARSVRPGPRQPTQRRLDVPVAQPRERDSDGEGDHGERPEVSGERPDVKEPRHHQ